MAAVATIDFETNELSPTADVIEVGFATFDEQDTIRTWSSLVWTHPRATMSEASYKIHKIPLTALKGAPQARTVAAELNRFLGEIGIVYCDGFPFDPLWMNNLFEAGKVIPLFELRPSEEMLQAYGDNVWLRMRIYLRQTPIVHRAGPDALRLMKAYVHGIGKEAKVIPFP